MAAVIAITVAKLVLLVDDTSARPARLLYLYRYLKCVLIKAARCVWTVVARRYSDSPQNFNCHSQSSTSALSTFRAKRLLSWRSARLWRWQWLTDKIARNVCLFSFVLKSTIQAVLCTMSTWATAKPGSGLSVLHHIVCFLYYLAQLSCNKTFHHIAGVSRRCRYCCSGSVSCSDNGKDTNSIQ